MIHAFDLIFADIVSVWENVSNFIEKQMSNQKVFIFNIVVVLFFYQLCMLRL